MATRSTGIAYEREVRHWYEHSVPNPIHIMRSAGSHGAADLAIFYPDGDIKLVQCKTRPSTTKDMNEGRSFSKAMLGYTVEFWHRAKKYHWVDVFVHGEHQGLEIYPRGKQRVD